VNPHQPGAAGSSSSTAATPPSTPHHRPSWLSFRRTRWVSPRRPLHCDCGSC